MGFRDWPAAAALVLVALSGAQPAFALTAAAARVGERPAVGPGDLVSVRRLFQTLSRDVTTATGRVAASAEISLLAEAVLGEARPGGVTFDDLASSPAGSAGPPAAVPADVAMRDAAAYRLLALGYSPRETADIVSGRITRHALDTARRMIAVGRGHDTAGRYLDGQYALARAWRAAAEAPRPGRRVGRGRFDAAIDRFARVHAVDANIVRAIIDVESGFDPVAISPAGAIGLMQLMPATARELGVDPFVPEENIEGGVRYLSGLLDTFGGLEMALVAYNAGPGFARRYARGRTALYGETREYVSRVLARLSALR